MNTTIAVGLAALLIAGTIVALPAASADDHCIYQDRSPGGVRVIVAACTEGPVNCFVWVSGAWVRCHF